MMRLADHSSSRHHIIITAIVTPITIVLTITAIITIVVTINTITIPITIAITGIGITTTTRIVIAGGDRMAGAAAGGNATGI